jgi:Domain of unknown function (DUF6089)
MKKIFVLILLVIVSKSNAQIHEIGVFLGGSNYIGEVGKTNYINPNELAFGILYKWNKSPRHSYRFSLVQSQISANDLDSKEGRRRERGYKFTNNITEASVGLEFNFFKFNLHEMDRVTTPYVYSGISYFAYNELYVFNGETKIDYKDSALAIPIALGVKSNIMPHLILGAEVGVRFTYTDNLDGSNPKNQNLQSLQFGNVNSKDWYVFSGFTLTYTFGNKPCYCVE